MKNILYLIYFTNPILKGNQLVSWLKERKSFNAQQAVALGNELLEKGYFRKSTKLGKFGNDDSRYVFAVRFN